jgi:hypothetical protein
MRSLSPAALLADRLCRPQHIGLFGHRGVGKTTFLTMLYREAVGGRLPGLRLAAADARTANYLSDKILQLEGGQPLPATLGETELRFHLYRGGQRLELLVKDYQGEHVAVGREEPIREFLRDCDAVWLCLDVTVAGARADTLRAEQEVEQMVEDYLKAESPGEVPRPMALVLTKADLLVGDRNGPGMPEQGIVNTLVEKTFRMTRHALTSHAPQHSVLAVSSLGAPLPSGSDGTTPPAVELHPIGMDAPLDWLAQALQTQDEERMNRLWEMAGNDLGILSRCVKCFARRYPDAPTTAVYRKRLRGLQLRKLRQRALACVLAALALVLGVWAYDAAGLREARRFESAASSDDLVSVRRRWTEYQTWHPTRHWLRPAAAQAEADHLRELDQKIRDREIAERLAEVRRRATDPDENPENVWALFKNFQNDFPDQDVDQAVQDFRDTLRQRRDDERARRAQDAFDELVRAEARTTIPEQLARAEKYLKEHGPDSVRAADVRKRIQGYLARIDEHDMELARDYSARQPFNFYTRRERFQEYLQKHPDGAYASEARLALATIESEWDKHDFRTVRDHYQAKPAEIKDLETLARTYVAAHPQGKYVENAKELLRWAERVKVESEYKVTLKRGSFDPKAAAFFSRGLHLSVEIEVNGVLYGPTTIVKRSSEPEWNYEFPRPIKWKLGDRVRIWAKDNYYWYREVAFFASADDDLLGMKMLSDTVTNGKNSLMFESDFNMPVMPKLE